MRPEAARARLAPMTRARLRIEKVMIASIMGFDCGHGHLARATISQWRGSFARYLAGSRFERTFAAVAAQEDDLAGDDDTRRRPHRAERLVRHRTELLALGQRAILGRELLELADAAEAVVLVALASGPGAAARSPRPAPK